MGGSRQTACSALRRRRLGTQGAALALLLWSLFAAGAESSAGVPPSWVVLPFPRYADYSPEEAFLPLKNAAVVSRQGGPYRTTRTPQGELDAGSTVIEEELLAILAERGVTAQRAADTPQTCEGFDTLILLGPPERNAQTAAWFACMGLSFDRWDDPHTPEDDFTGWPDLGPEGYVLKTGTVDGKTIILLAGYDFDDVRKRVYCAGTFYALQSFRQLLVEGGGSVKVKAAEIVDKPLLAIRGCYGGFDADEKQEWRNIAFMAQMKANQDVYWYGNCLAGYNGEAASRFRYPWKPEQLDCFRRIGRYCREHFITMVFCMNPDHYTVEWAAAKTFDGSRKDPLHYDFNRPVEREFQEMWKRLGFEVKNDVDILAAKFRQLAEAVPGAMLQVMNEDDVFGLVHEDDKCLFNTQTGDPVEDAVNYGRARAQFLAALYQRVKELCPDYPGFMPVCPPNQVCYQFVLENNDHHSREFMTSLGGALKELGLQDVMPVITTGGGTAAEVVTGKQIDDFRSWCSAAPVVLHDNNFPQGFHIGAYETDPAGLRFPLQANAGYPAGYRDKGLYKRLWGIHWNGLNDQHVLGWCQAQYMWNMAALEREKLNALATRKVSSDDAYPLVKSLYEEFDNPACYLPDNQPPLHVLQVSDGMAFAGEGQNGWQYAIRYTDDLRREAQRLREKLSRVKPELEKRWDAPFERTASLKYLGDRAYAFCAVYLAYGYIQGWEGRTPEAWLERAALRDLFLEADDIQERFFAGPDEVPGRTFADRQAYTSALHFIYTDGKFEPSPENRAGAARYVDIWENGLRDTFLTRVLTVSPGALPDRDPQITGAWGPSQDSEGERFRAVDNEAAVVFDRPIAGPVLVRVRLGLEAASFAEHRPLVLEAGDAEHHDIISKVRWLNWRMPGDASVAQLAIKAQGPVRVYTVEVYKERENLTPVPVAAEAFSARR